MRIAPLLLIAVAVTATAGPPAPVLPEQAATFDATVKGLDPMGTMQFVVPQSMNRHGDIRIYGNSPNWIDASSFPTRPVRAFWLPSNSESSASFAPGDAKAPHLNTYSMIPAAAAAGGCWACPIKPTPGNVYGP